MNSFAKPHVLFTTLITSAVLLAGCQPPGAEEDASSARSSDRGGIGMRSQTQAVVSPSQVVNARKSLAVTDTAILANFTLSGVLNQLAAQNGNPNFTGNHLFRQLWETQNSIAGPADLQPSAHCSDNGNTLNGFPLSCRPQEGAQANAANATNINSYSAIGLFNRFDLAPGNGEDCGEYRIVFGKTSGGTGRNFIIFEATLPNPRQDLGLEGCRQVQAFWRDLSNNTNVTSRGTALRDFYFQGLPGYQPVVHLENFGFNSTGVGQIRVNMFIQPVWLLKEFKLDRTCPNGACSLKARPVTVKTNPFGGLFNPNSTHTLASQFRSHFVSQVPALAVNNVNTFNYSVPDMFNSGQSDAQNGGVVDDYMAQFGTGASTLRSSIQAKLTEIGSPLTPDQVVARAQALSCGGCHQRSNFASLGSGIQFPQSASFVHSTEFIEAGPDGNRFALSSALTGTFLPFRKSVMEEFLSVQHSLSNERFDMAGSAADSLSAYWVENRASGSVVKASLNSGGEQVLAFNRPNPRALATDGINVYWIEGTGTILKVPVNGGAITTLATGLTGIGGGLATDGTNLFWTQGTSIVRMPVTGGVPTTLFSNRVGLTGRLAVDSTSLYWQEGNSIMNAGKAGGATSVLLTRASITGLATDGTHVYLAENLSPGNVLRIPVTGGAVATFLSGPQSLTSVAVGPGHVVWTANTSPGPIMAKVKN